MGAVGRGKRGGRGGGGGEVKKEAVRRLLGEVK
jgi:hypothetical protein